MATSPVPTEAEARKAMTEVIDALTEWRGEVAASSKRFNDVILDKIADAAATLGWPRSVLEATKSALYETSEAQLKLIDQMADAWRQQLKSPLSGGFPISSSASVSFNPMDLWLQAATAWQKSLTDSWQAFADRGRRM